MPLKICLMLLSIFSWFESSLQVHNFLNIIWSLKSRFFQNFSLILIVAGPTSGQHKYLYNLYKKVLLYILLSSSDHFSVPFFLNIGSWRNGQNCSLVFLDLFSDINLQDPKFPTIVLKYSFSRTSQSTELSSTWFKHVTSSQEALDDGGSCANCALLLFSPAL